MKLARTVLVSFLALSSTTAAAQQRADAVLIVNSASPAYGDATLHVRPYLDHFGVPYTVVDLATTTLGSELETYALIIIGHPSLDTTGTRLDAAAQQAIVNAVSLGTGLVSFDHDLSSNRTGRYDYVQQIFGFGYSWNTSGEGVVFTADAPNHYISSRHAAASVFGLKQVASASLVPAADTTVLAQFGDVPDAFLVAKPYGLGRAVQWGSSGWMSPPQHRGDLKGPMRGIDDLVWRSLAWAARKPFVMQGLPNFVTMRVDDVQGPLAWAHVANEFGLKPFMAVFYDQFVGSDSIDLANLTNAGNATASVHSSAQAPFYFDHFGGTDWPDATMANHIAGAKQWHDSYNIPISSVVVPHFYEVGTNAFPYLAQWGVRSIATHMTPGSGYTDTVPWLQLAPFRLHEAGLANTAAPVTYADYLAIPNHPELANRFFNCVTEIRDDNGYEWTPSSTDLQGTIDRGTRQTKRAFDAMAMATLFTHEYYIQPFATADWRTVLGQIRSNLSGYAPEYVTLDYACDYLRAKHDTKITSAVFDPATQVLHTGLGGTAQIPTRFLVFTEAGGFIQQAFQTVPAFSGTTLVDRSLPAGTVPTLTSITVTPANPAVYVGATRQLAATAGYSDGSSLTVTNMVAWSSSSTGVATVSAAGLATATGVGTATLTATLSGVSGSTTITTSIAPLQITTAALEAGAQTIPYGATFAAIGGVPPYAWARTAGALPPGLTLSPDGVLSGTPTSSGDFTFTVTLTDANLATASAPFTLTIAPFTSGTLWPATAVPTQPDRGDDAGGPIELGIKFRSDVGGWISGLRFYKAAANTGVHTGNLWSAAGDLLTSAVFSGETASGWQQVQLVEPVYVATSTIYVASYHNAVGHYAHDVGYFTDAGQDRAPLHAPRSADVGGNGVFLYTPSSAFPTDTVLDSNYWVDVVFTPTDPGGLTSLAITPPAPTLELGGTAQLTASGTFSDGVADVSGQVLWSSSNPSVATVSFLGVVTAQAAGTTTVTASAGATTATATVRVLGPLASIAVSPSSARLVAGGTQQFTAAGFDAVGQERPGLTFTWSATAGGAVDGTGLFTAGAAAGSFTGNVVATSGTVSGAASTEVVAVAGVSVSPASVPAGLGATGTVTLSGAAPAGGAQVALASDTAAVVVPASVTVTAGATWATFVVTTAASAPAAATLTATLGGSVTTTLAVVAPVPVTVSLSPAAVTGGTGSTGTVTLSAAAATDVTVSLASGDAAATVPASVTVLAGSSSATFSVTTVPVGQVTNASITATAASVSASGALTVNPPTLRGFTVSPGAVAGGNTATGSVRLNSAAPAGGATVQLSSNVAGVTLPATVVVAAGQTLSPTFVVATTPVSTSTTATLTATYAGSSRSAPLVVNPPTASRVSLSAASVVGGTSVTGTVQLASVAPAGGTVITLSSSDPVLAVPSSVTVAAGATTASFGGTTTPTAVNVTATVTAAAPTGAPVTATLTVTRPGLSGVSVTPGTVLGSRTANGSVVLNGNAPAGGIVVAVSVTGPSASLAVSSVTVPAGGRSAPFTISTTPVAVNTSATVSGTLDAVTRTRSFTITRPAVTGFSLSPSSLTGGTSSSALVTISGPAPAGGAAIQVLTSAPATAPTTVTVPEGSTSTRFTVSTSPVATAAAPVLYATGGGVTRTATLTVNPPAVTGVSLSATSVAGGGPVDGTVTLSGIAPEGGAVVTLTSSSAAATVPASVTVPAGATSAPFTVTTAVITSSVSATVTASSGGGSASASLVVRGLAVTGLAVSQPSVVGGGDASVTVTLSNAALAGGFPVQVLSSDPAASPPATVLVPQGFGVWTFAVPTNLVTSSTPVTLYATGGQATAIATFSVEPMPPQP